MQALLIDANPRHRDQLCAQFAERNLAVTCANSRDEAMKLLRSERTVADLIAIVVADRSLHWPKFLQELQIVADRQSLAMGPLLMCISTIQQEPSFRLQLERRCARYIHERDAADVLEAVDLLVAERRELNANGVHFRILHRLHMPHLGQCSPGEEIAAISLLHRGKPIQLRLSLSLRLVFDFLGRHARLPQSAGQIEVAMRANHFYTQHGTNAGDLSLTRSIPRSCVRVYADRLRQALGWAFKEAGLTIDPREIIVAEETAANEVGYRIKGTFEWVHVDHPGSDFSAE